MKKRKKIWLAVLIVVIGLGLTGWWWMGGYVRSSIYWDITSNKPSPNAPLLFYHGIHIPGIPLVLFKRYYAIMEFMESPEYIISVDYKAPGYNSFTMVYSDGEGTLGGEGYCKVEKLESRDEIFHNINDVKWGIFYKPDGTEASKVIDGTGIQRLYFPDGNLCWELELKDYRRVRLKWWREKEKVFREYLYDENGKEIKQ